MILEFPPYEDGYSAASMSMITDRKCSYALGTLERKVWYEGWNDFSLDESYRRKIVLKKISTKFDELVPGNLKEFL